MKIGEQFIREGDKIIHKRTFDPTPTLERLRGFRDAGVKGMGESRHVGTVPGWMVSQWLKEAGVAWHDVEARDQVIKRKLMDGEFSALRNWTGTY